MCRLKKFTDPENTKFKNDQNIREHTVEDNNDMEKPQMAKDEVQKDRHRHKANELIKKFN